MQYLDNQTRDAIACLLIINPIPKLSELAILSVLENTSLPVAVGYLNESDLPAVAQDSRVKKIPLSEEVNKLFEKEISQGTYQDFSKDDFFTLVQAKWILFQKLLSAGYSEIFYSDVDVVWIKNPVTEILDFFSKAQEVHWLIQSFTTSPEEPKLCMGFAAFRNTEIVKSFIDLCAEEHALGLKSNPRLGDDEVISALNQKLGFPTWIKELPQATFPVGSMLNLFSKRNLYPGLSGPKPYIFHANYVVGLENKILLLKLFLHSMKIKNLNFTLDFHSRMKLSLKQLRLLLWKVINAISVF